MKRLNKICFIAVLSGLLVSFNALSDEPTPSVTIQTAPTSTPEEQSSQETKPADAAPTSPIEIKPLSQNTSPDQKEPEKIEPKPLTPETPPAPAPVKVIPSTPTNNTPSPEAAPTPRVSPQVAPTPPTPAMPAHMRHRRQLFESRERRIVVPAQGPTSTPTPTPSISAPVPAPAAPPHHRVIVNPTPSAGVLPPSPQTTPAVSGKTVIVQPGTPDEQSSFQRRIRDERESWDRGNFNDPQLRVRVLKDNELRNREIRARQWESVIERDNELRYLEWRERQLRSRYFWYEQGRRCHFETYYQKVVRVNRHAKVCVWRNGVYTCFHPKRYLIVPVTRVICYRVRVLD